MEQLVNLRCLVRKRNLLAHISIWLIIAFLLTISLTIFNGTLIGIIYLVFFLAFVLLFQSSYSLWARQIKTFSVLLVLYSTSICVLTYSYQYEGVNTLFKDLLPEQVLKDIGLVVRNQIWLIIVEPLLPLLLTIALALYLKIFEDDFARFAYLAEEDDSSLSTPLTCGQALSSQVINESVSLTVRSSEVINHPSSASSVDCSQTNLSKADLKRELRRFKLQNLLRDVNECVWRILETHFIKIVVFMIFRLPVIDVCLMNLPFLIIAILALKYPSTAKCSCLTASWFIAFIVIIRNLSNLTVLRVYDINNTCDQSGLTVTYSYLDYIGLNHDTGNPLNRVDNHIIVLLLITLFSFISIHYERRPVKDYELSLGVIFTGVGRREADQGIINTFKYLCNFGFYKFGIEFTCLALVIAISNRLDVFAAIYGITLTLLSITTSKRTLTAIWPVFNILVGLLIVIQYILRLGIPKALCLPYPWDGMAADFKIWLFLSDYSATQDIELVLYDFLIYLAICRQSVVFRHMRINSNTSLRDRQSHHDFTANQFRQKYLPSPEEFETEDCFSNYTTQSNYLKSIFFMSIYWITLAVVLVAGATKISLFSLGYLIGCFIFLLLGNDTYLMPLKRLIFSWNWFILYVTLVIFAKVVLQLFACYLHEYLMNHCYILQLLRVVCLRKMEIKPAPDPTAACAASLPSDELDILWDGLCLMFLLMQRVVFGSQYFNYLVQEVRAQQILASRGAELILATQIEEAKAQDLYEKEVMRSVREKMENLKTDSEETSKAWRRLLSLPHHHQIIRNADRHLFSSVLDDPVSMRRTEDLKFKKAFIPDPIGDELERMAEINGISAVFIRWMKGKQLYGNATPTLMTNSPSSPRDASDTIDGQVLPHHIANSQEQEHELQSFDMIQEEVTMEVGKIRGCWEMLNLIVYSCLLSATVELNKLSRSYRYVSRRMAVEKNILKRKFNLNDERFKSDPAWRKWVIGTLSETYTKAGGKYKGAQSSTSLHRIRSALKVIAASSAGTTTTVSQDGQSVDSERSPSSSSQKQARSELADPEYHFLKLNMFTQFFRALAYVFISNTSLLCQIIIVFNQMLTASLLSLPLPLLTFLWGTLSVPRPTKRFWKTVITYTELVIVIKYVCQFPIWEWETNNINPFYYPNLLGIKDITIVYDLFLLLSLFFHRSMLKSLGQWDATANQISDYVPEKPSSEEEITGIHYRGDTVAFKRESSPEEVHFGKSLQLHKELNSSIELEPRMASSDEIDRAHIFNDYIHDSYHNQVHELKIEEDVPVTSVTNTCCNCCFRAYIRVRRSVGSFFQHVLNTPYKVQTDVYTWMFLCDFINFLILIYGFWAFGSGYTNQTVANFLDENRIPFSVLIMLLAQFASIIIDRSLYLQKEIAGKLLFQVVLVIGIHIWLFFALPLTTGHTLTLKEYWPPKAWYVFKCLYFLLSAHQIRSGYPRRVLGNCFTKGFGYVNWGVFKVYRAIPLVYDLRLYMDWIWTETTLEFRNWAIMEDMFANLFIRKCELAVEEEYPIPRAKPIRRISKYLTGGSFILLILAIIWGPLLLFSMGKTVGESNPPVEMEFELEFIGFQPILRMRATAQQIIQINDQLYDLLKGKFSSQTSQSFLGDYKVGDVAAIRLDGQSNAVWEISPPSKESLMNSIKNNQTLTLKSSWTLFRIKREKSQNFDVNIAGSYQNIISNASLQFRTALYDMLADSSTTATPPSETKFVITPPIFPNYIRVPETGQVSLVNQFEDNLFAYEPLRPLNLTYIRMYDTTINQIDNSTSWWKADDLCKHSPTNDSYSFWSSDQFPHCDSLVVVAFNDRIFTGILALLSAPGIIGLYTTFVVFFARLIRTEPSGKVIYTEIPKVDRVYGLIMDIYMMRECKEFELEEKLFAKLLFLYRSPEMLIEWSRREDEPLEINNPPPEQ
mgnify:CR=1 FL=1